MEATRITATELARNLSDVLNRVRYRGESFDIMRKGEVVAQIRPEPGQMKVLTVAEFRGRFAGVKVPDGLGEDIEEARKALGPLPDLQ